MAWLLGEYAKDRNLSPSSRHRSSGLEASRVAFPRAITDFRAGDKTFQSGAVKE
jgi:hypothetical protein